MKLLHPIILTPDDHLEGLSNAQRTDFTWLVRVQRLRPAWGLWQGLRVMGDPGGVAAEDTDPTAKDGDGQAGRPQPDPTSVLLVILDAAGARHFNVTGSDHDGISVSIGPCPRRTGPP